MVKITDLLRNMGNGARIATALLAVGGIVFQTGRISQNVDDLIPRIHALENKILIKVDNEIITSLDINNEINYLLALNKNIQSLDKQKIYDIAKNSLIRENIKKIMFFKDVYRNSALG